MSHGARCPICEGNGKINKGSGWVPDMKICHGCGGKGWVEISDNTGISLCDCYTGKDLTASWCPVHGANNIYR